MLERYLGEVEVWNRRINLTAIAAGESWIRHVGESLRLEAAAQVSAGDDVIDVGSGAGLPGVVFAVLHPESRVVLLEANARKAGFLTHVAGVLGLGHVEVTSRRAEDAAHDPLLRGCFAVAVSRATATPAVLCEIALPFVRPGGRLLALVSDARRAAVAAAPAARACGGGEPLAVDPGILSVPKLAPTPGELPRRTGVPARRPLA